MNLKRLGWNNGGNLELKNNQQLARVTAVFRNKFKIQSEETELLADLKGNMIHEGLFPAVGDWVIVDSEHLIVDILERKSKISRQIAGKKVDEQVIAANIDNVFIVSSLNRDFNLSRLERYLTMVWESGANPVFLLTKSDVAEDLDIKLSELEAITFGVPIHVISSFENQGLEELKQYFINDKTSVFIGSSGVGKSTLINKLLGENVLETKEIREDGKGRHTTTHREMFFLKESGIIIDTPGMREIQLWSGNVETTFEDIEELTYHCKFRDCTHESEPGCAVREAIETGQLSEKRYENYKKLKKELEYDVLSHKQIEKKKLENMMGSFNEAKSMMKYVKEKSKRRDKNKIK